MQIIRIFVKKNQALIRIMLSFIIICAFLLSALSAILYREYSKNSMQDLYEISVDLLNQKYESVDSQMMAIYNYFTTVYLKDNLIFDALYSKTYEADTMYAINKRLNEFVQVNPLVESVYIYNKQAGMVFSSKTTAQDIGSFYDRDILDYLKTTESVNYPIFFTRKVHYRIYNKWEDLKLISIILSEPMIKSNPDAALIVNIRQDLIQKMISAKMYGDPIQTLITDTNGNIVIDTGGNIVVDNISKEEYYGKIQEGRNISGSFTAMIQGEKYFITYLKSSKALGWCFISLAEYEKLFIRISQLRNYIFLITGLFIAVAILISFLITRNLYKPIHNLLSMINSRWSNQKSQAPVGEFEFLNEAFSSLTANLSDMKSQLDNYRSVKKKEYLDKLLHGEIIPEQDREEDAEELKIDLDADAFLVCLIQIDSFKELSARYSSNQVLMFRLAISKIASEVFEGSYKMETVEVSQELICLLFNHEENNWEDSFKNNCKKLQETVARLMDISVTISVGPVADSPEEIHKSYAAALGALNYKIVKGKGAIICYDDISSNNWIKYAYPFDCEKKILDQIKLEDAEGAAEAIDRFIESIHGFSYEEIKLSLTQLALTEIKMATGTLNIASERLENHFQNVYNQIAECETFDDIKSYFNELSGIIINALWEKKDKKKGEKIEEIIHYIQENYDHPEITADSLADMADLSTNHLRLVFKEVTGKSLFAFLSEIRLTHAQRLLTETDYPAKKIAEMVGYENASYFYVRFKKFTGYTPEQYRNNFKKTK